MSRLPQFPVDEQTLDMLWTAIHPGGDAQRSSVGDLLVLFSQLGGSDTTAVVESESDDYIRMMRDPQYHEHDVIAALISEIRLLRRVIRWRDGVDQ